MKIRSILIKRANNLKEYPTLFVRSAIAILAGFFILDFDYISTGKSITEGNYWVTKCIICLCTLLLLEYNHRTHIFWSLKFQFSVSHRLMKVVLAQMIFGLTLPLFFIVQLLPKLLGITFFPSAVANITPELIGHRSIAMVFELEVLFNIILLLFYLDLPVFLKEASSYKLDDIAIFKHGQPVRIDIEEVIAIVCYKEGVNFLVTKHAGSYPLMSEKPLKELMGRLPEDKFDLRNNDIFRKTIEPDKEAFIIKYVRDSGDYMLLCHFRKL